jgi:hypothetical protein
VNVSIKIIAYGFIGLIIPPLFTYTFSHLNSIKVSAQFSQIPLIKQLIPTPTPNVTPTPLPSSTPTPTVTPSPRPTRIPTPTIIPTVTPFPISAANLDEWFTKYSNHYSIDRNKLWLIAVCESNLHPNSVNGIYGGLFQFAASSWRSTRSAMNEDSDPNLRFNPEEAIKTAAFKMSVSGYAAWPVCGK